MKQGTTMKKHVIEDRHWEFRFDGLNDLAEGLTLQKFSLSSTGISKVSKALGLRPKMVRDGLRSLGSPTPIKVNEMPGKTFTRGTILSFVRNARDGHGSIGRIYEAKDSNGTLFKAFVHNLNQNDHCFK